MSNPTQTTQPDLIQLGEAFRWVMIWLELTAGVPRSECLGRFPGQAPDYEPPPQPPATGPEYRLRFTTVTQPGRNRAPTTPGRASVPIVPDQAQLIAMLADDALPEATTEAERRCCQAHRLILEFATSGVRAFGDCWIDPADGGNSIQLGVQALPATVWGDAGIDYRSARVTAGGAWTAPIGAVVTGTVSYADVYLDRQELGQKLTARRPVSAFFVVKVNQDGAERFQITWNGAASIFRFHSVTEARRLRAFRGLVILIRNIDQPVAYHLINYLAVKSVNSRQQDTATRNLSEELERKVKPIAERLYKDIISLVQAHRELDAVLDARFASPSQLARASWSARYDPTSPTAALDVELYKTVKENTQKSINLAISYIRKKAPVVADYLENALVRSSHAVRLARNPRRGESPRITDVPAYSVSWRVAADPEATTTDAPGSNTSA